MYFHLNLIKAAVKHFEWIIQHLSQYLGFSSFSLCTAGSYNPDIQF